MALTSSIACRAMKTSWEQVAVSIDGVIDALDVDFVESASVRVGLVPRSISGWDVVHTGADHPGPSTGTGPGHQRILGTSTGAAHQPDQRQLRAYLPAIAGKQFAVPPWEWPAMTRSSMLPTPGRV